MHKAFIILSLVIVFVTGCKKSSAPAAVAGSTDVVEQQLRNLAGAGARNCGRVPGNGDVKGASDCAMQASAARQPFYVAYDLPGLTVAVAGTSDGKLFSLQSQPSANGQADQGAIKSAPCPAELRVAQSGRVTCMTPGSMGMGTPGGASPQGGMVMPPGGENPHGGGMMMPPAGTPNPHGGMGTAPGTSNPHGRGDNVPSKQPPAKRSSDI
jgi:hypothetical protein